MARTRKNTGEQTAKIAAAYELGKAAYAKGIYLAPCQDAEMMALISGPVGGNIEVLKAWRGGWMNANVADMMATIDEVTA